MPDDEVIDSSPTNDTTSDSSLPSAESGGTDTSTDVSQSQSSPAVDGTSPDASAPADSQPGDGNPGQQGSAETKATSPEAWEKRYKDTQSWATKTHQEKLELERRYKEAEQRIQEMESRYAGVKPDEIEKWRSQQALNPWDEGSPEHQFFLDTVREVRVHERLIQKAANPEQRKMLQELAAQDLGDKKLQLIERWREDVRNQENERQLNPRAYYAKLIKEQAQPVVRETLQHSNQQYQQAVQGREEAQKWMAENKEVATPENIQQVLKHMSEHRMPFNIAAAIVERDHYRNQVSNATKAKQSAEEKERLLQGNAAGGISRNPASSSKLNVAEHLKKVGPDSRSKIDALFDLQQQGLL